MEGNESSLPAASTSLLNESHVFEGLSQNPADALYKESSSSSSNMHQGVDEWITSPGAQLASPRANVDFWQSAIDFNINPSPVNQHNAIPYIIPMTLGNTIHRSLTSKYAANLLTHAISAFPQMMLRRQTFPPFIHAHWHMPSLPETLANCMSISQSFAARTPETRPFLWRMVGAEVKRFQDEVRHHT